MRRVSPLPARIEHAAACDLPAGTAPVLACALRRMITLERCTLVVRSLSRRASIKQKFQLQHWRRAERAALRGARGLCGHGVVA